jgi:hypothetical protein
VLVTALELLVARLLDVDELVFTLDEVALVLVLELVLEETPQEVTNP